MKKIRIAIIGGVAAGASAAGKAARTNPDAEITIFEKGPYISFAGCGLPYYISGEVRDRGRLIVRRPADLKEKYGIEVFVNTEVTAIQRHSRKLDVKNLTDGTTWQYEYDKLIIATGASTIIPKLPGIDGPGIFSLRTIPDVDSIEDYIRNNSPVSAVVIGGGYIGIEAADVLCKRGLNTSVFEMAPQILPPFDPEIAQFIENRMKEKGVHIFKGSPVERIDAGGGGTPRRVCSADGRWADADLIIMSLGVRPNIKLAVDAGLNIGKFGISTDDYMCTSDPDIYAAGDAVESMNIVTGSPSWSPLAGPANQQGKVAGCNAAGGFMRFAGVLRTSIVAFDGLAAARTGITEKEILEEGLDYFTIMINSSSHAGYYPGSKPIHLKGIFRKQTGKLLGAQVVGEEGADKRIDVLATAITAGMTAEDLESLDLAYSPQYSHPRDIVNVLGSSAKERMGKD
ncbi:MAG: FAD-dependent oxidoreductase [Firmicutes bacterium]|nr:FAD-dependent oxidoreductase [Bacillota bacterium]